MEKSLMGSKKAQTMILGIASAVGTQFADQPWWMAVIAAVVASIYILSQAYLDRGVRVAQIQAGVEAAKAGLEIGKKIEEDTKS